jgi:hypothetical protein
MSNRQTRLPRASVPSPTQLPFVSVPSPGNLLSGPHSMGPARKVAAAKLAGRRDRLQGLGRSAHVGYDDLNDGIRKRREGNVKWISGYVFTRRWGWPVHPGPIRVES